METFVCKNCGKVVAVSEARWHGTRNGGRAMIQLCRGCFDEKQRQGKEKAKAKMYAEMERKVGDAKQSRLSEFTPRELMEELKRRGYEFTMRYVETHIIKSDDL